MTPEEILTELNDLKERIASQSYIIMRLTDEVVKLRDRKRG